MEIEDICITNKSRVKYGRMIMLLGGFVLFLVLFMMKPFQLLAAEDTDQEEQGLMTAGIASIINPTTVNSELISTGGGAEKSLNIDEKFKKEQERIYSEFAMANVSQALNMRSEADEESKKVGMLYKDCGGTILEQKDGWTKIKSGDVIGWAKNEYLYFGSEAQSVADDVGNWLATIEVDAVRVRQEPNLHSEIMGLVPQDEGIDIIEVINKDWISVAYGEEEGYVSTDYVNVVFYIDTAESIEVINAREREAAERKRMANRGSVSASADELQLLAALIYCEAGNQSYEGKVGVGAVVMNRVKSGAYPNTIHSVIYASGQFTPALNGKVARVYENGKIQEECIRAASAALNGETTVGGATHFRRAGNREGLIIGAHVFW